MAAYGETTANDTANPERALSIGLAATQDGAFAGTRVYNEKDLEDGLQAEEPELDIEHLLVHDDPRKWSYTKKNLVLALISFTAMGATLPANIFYPGIADLKKDLHASDNLVSATVSIFVLGQGVFPMCWSGISEIQGRKTSYIVSLVLYCAGSAVCSRANTIGVFIGMRVLQSLGASAVLSLGGGTLADMYDAEERGRKLGIFYGLPLVSPAIGPVIGGLLTAKSSWRATFYFLVAFGGACLLGMVFFPETFRKERSLAWQQAMKRARANAKSQRRAARDQLALEPQINDTSAAKNTKVVLLSTNPHLSPTTHGMPAIEHIRTDPSSGSRDDHVKIRLADINPFAAVGGILRLPHNFLTILYSALLFGSQYSLPFTASTTFAAPPFSFGALDVGLCLLSFGIGNVVGSVCGGRYSDYVLAKLKAKNGGIGEPEMRIKSTIAGLILLPPLLIGYAWTVQEKVGLAGPLVFLFFVGLATIWIYSSTLAFVVDANPGRASSAVACNSLLRGFAAATASQACGPLVEKMGNGFYYTGYAIILFVSGGALLLVSSRGAAWRATAREKQSRRDRES